VPFYFRRSVKAGPFRFNFSRGGVGVSVGVRGLRLGTGPRGHYISAGAGGFYYRALIGNAGKTHNIQTPRENKPAGIPCENSSLADVRQQLTPNHPAPKRSYAGYWALLFLVSVPTIALLIDHNNGTSISGARVVSGSPLAPGPSPQTNILAVPSKAASAAPTTSTPSVFQAPSTEEQAATTPAQEASAVEPNSVTASPSPPDADAFESLVSALPSPTLETLPAVLPAPPTPKFGYVKLPLQLREGPNQSYVVVTTLPQNLQVAIIGQENGWTRVSAGPGAMGWLPKEMIGKSPVAIQTMKPKVKTQNSSAPREGGR
jgi:hypothetical protein